MPFFIPIKMDNNWLVSPVFLCGLCTGEVGFCKIIYLFFRDSRVGSEREGERRNSKQALLCQCGHGA